MLTRFSRLLGRWGRRERCRHLSTRLLQPLQDGWGTYECYQCHEWLLLRAEPISTALSSAADGPGTAAGRSEP